MNHSHHANDVCSKAADRIPVSEHQRAVKELVGAVLDAPSGLERERVSLAAALGRRLGEDVRASVNVPPRANSQMDGFAVRVSDFSSCADATLVTLRLGPLVAAGDPPTAAPVREGASSGVENAPAMGVACPIMTGAIVPDGFDAIIPVEETILGAFSQVMVRNEGGVEGALASELSFTLTPDHRKVGRYVRAAGSDTQIGDVVAREGQVLSARMLGHLASLGVAEVWVWQKPRAIVVSTGSELADPTAPELAEEWQIFDANSTLVSAALSECGVEVCEVLRVPDDPQLLLGVVGEAVSRSGAHLVVSTGGVSAGAVEPIRQAAELPDSALRLAFDKVAMQPGGPQGLGVLDGERGEVAWIALPGNPVSALLSVEMFVREAVRATPRARVRVPVQTQTGSVESSPEALLQIRRARLTSDSTARLVGGPGSHLLGALALSDALVLVPEGVGEVHNADVLEAIIVR